MPDAAKAAHYIQALDAARVEGNWSAVPEFVRKIRKHAPERACLTLTAEVEHSISTASKSQSAAASSARPTTASTVVPAKDLDAASRLPKLLAAIDHEDVHPQDRFQARVCVGWLHWTIGEYSLAAVRLPDSLGQEQVGVDTSDKISEWTNVCALKAAYLKADCLVVNKQTQEALSVFENALPSLGGIWAAKTAGKQLRYCSELFLTEFCMLQSKALQTNERSLEDPDCLGPFRSWARYWEAHSRPVLGGHGFRGSVPRRRVWNEYYLALSKILGRDLPLPTGYMGDAGDGSDRNQLRIELKRVEAAFEALLLNETRFPRADEERAEVESFVKAVMNNWGILCGSGWRDEDLGPGGREGLSRGVLDILYRAATKTYHSTAVLRSLFTVHLAVSEFELAFKAFDSYSELVKNGKARVDKTGHLEVGLDDDGTVLEAMSHCILALCRFGRREAAEKARDIGSELEDLMARLPQLKAGVSDGSTLPEIEETTNPLHPEIAPSTVALSWQAIGLAHAHWARVTYDAASRTEIQAKAVRCLRKAVSPELGRTRDVRSLFALGLLLAERRELTPAIDIVKSALMSNKSAEHNNNPCHGPYWQERSLIPLWHLLSLLLSARQDYTMAARSCEGAFEQFRDPKILFGDECHFRSEHLNELEGGHETRIKGVVDVMEDFERESIIEVKITQLCLIELLEGPDVAVNASFELLTVFGRLFGDIQPKQQSLNPATAAEAPRSSAGTLRSIKGSIFGGRSVRSSRQERPPSVLESEKTEKTTTLPSRPLTTQTTASGAPTIQVTGENGHLTERRPSRRLSSRRGRSESGRRNSLRKRDNSGSRQRAPSAGAVPQSRQSHSPSVVDGENFFTPSDEPSQTDLFKRRRQPAGSASFSKGSSPSHLDSFASQASNKSTAANSSYSEISPDATYTITTPLPLVQFSADQVRRQRTALLVRVWLVIAGFYRRADKFEDCRGAVAEARKLVEGLEAERDASGNPASYRTADWGEKKTVDELWGDVWAELGHMSAAKGAPFEARASFEAALVRHPDHPSAIVGLSNILLDIYTEEIKPPPMVPDLSAVNGSIGVAAAPANGVEASLARRSVAPSQNLPSKPIGLGETRHDDDTTKDSSGSSPYPRRPSTAALGPNHKRYRPDGDSNARSAETLPAPYKADSVPLIDRLAARDRASALLSSLTKLGSGWDYPEAWFALARAHEESGLPERAKEVLWWCVELEEGRGVRGWRCLGSGGYVL